MVYMVYDWPHRWQVKKGIKMKEPMMGHCVAKMDAWTIVVAGGFSPVTADYIDQAHFLNTRSIFECLKNRINMTHF